MKKINVLWIAVLAILFAACNSEEPAHYTVVDFEDVVLDAQTGVWNGSDLSGTATQEESYGTTVTNYYGSFASGICSFANVYTPEWFSWMGFACSNNTDTITTGYTNQYSVQAASGAAGSKQFAVVYSNATLTCNSEASFKSLMLCNSVYAYRSLAFAENNCKQLVEGDYFKVIITGKTGETEIGSIEYYLADFRNGKTFINDNWVEVDLSVIAQADTLVFTFDSTDANEWGLLTPTYVCVDNITLEIPNKK